MATVDELRSEMDIKIIGIDLVQGSVPMNMMLLDVLNRAAGLANSKRITITIMEPQNDGSFEWSMQAEWRTGGGMYICCLRRTPTSKTEFHS